MSPLLLLHHQDYDEDYERELSLREVRGNSKTQLLEYRHWFKIAIRSLGRLMRIDVQIVEDDPPLSRPSHTHYDKQQTLPLGKIWEEGTYLGLREPFHLVAHRYLAPTSRPLQTVALL
jgi:hypothetical protein